MWATHVIALAIDEHTVRIFRELNGHLKRKPKSVATKIQFG